ncbi:ComF family protein [Paenibacillus physcomitrellae]|uniref:Amidophosphoribosyltransferase n=1 Tax=Paenibacillus physcomitrellae TaxID=1619311 RepID=A0ABQ1GHE7_9BACL|nr:ComF family protein [Paenibacillus physcomitrellae]GGA43749.1 amidophosphoribosyltransferase [Paenibacillus physcomitrellae]
MPSIPLLEQLYALLAPSVSICLGCGKQTRRMSDEFPELCPTCAGSIPWIKVPRCPICGRGMGCPDCIRGDWAVERSFVLNRSAVLYDDRMREWLGQYKYRGRETLAPLFGKMMVQAYNRLEQEMRKSWQDPNWRIDAVTCVPVSPSRWLERGFNQAEQLAEAVAKRTGAAFIPLLERSRDTEKQSLKSRSERLKDMKKVFVPGPGAADHLNHLIKGLESCGVSRSNAFQAQKRSSRPKPLRFLLVDDIYTTGSTIGACAAQLQMLTYSVGQKAEIYSLTWARS